MHGIAFFLPQIDSNTCDIVVPEVSGLTVAVPASPHFGSTCGTGDIVRSAMRDRTKKGWEGSSPFLLNCILEDVAFISSSGIYLETGFECVPVFSLKAHTPCSVKARGETFSESVVQRRELIGLSQPQKPSP